MKVIINSLLKTYVWTIAFAIFNLLVVQNSFGQYQAIGDTMPEHLFSDVSNIPDNSVKISDYRGKWLVLDFWSASCVNCIASFPKMNELHQKFKGKAELLMVGVYRNKEVRNSHTGEQIIKSIYEYRRKRNKLTFPMAFDSTVMIKFDLLALPMIMIVNPEGKLVAKTISIDSTSLAELIEGKRPYLQYAYSAHEKNPFTSYNYKVPLLTNGSNGNGGVDTTFIYRSILTDYDGRSMPYLRFYGWDDASTIKTRNRNYAEALGVSLTYLFRLGNYGQLSWNYNDNTLSRKSMDIVLQVKNDSLFKNGKDGMKNLYSYSVKLPPRLAVAKNFRLTLLEDIKRCFGLVSSIELRKTPIYKLVVKDIKRVSRLKSKGGQQGIWVADNKGGFKIQNLPISSLLTSSGLSLGLEGRYVRKGQMVPPLIDSTDINYNIDLEYNGDVTNFEDTLLNLRKYGLDLVPDSAEMERIVVRDL